MEGKLEVVKGEKRKKGEGKGIGESEKRRILKRERAGSVGMIEDWMKKKREESEEEEEEGGEMKAFQKSRKMQRSPVNVKKEEGNMGLLLQEIRAMRLKEKKDREELKGTIEEMRREIGGMKEEMGRKWRKGSGRRKGRR